jgi:guanylate kinase
LVVLSGPSGVGKGTVVARAMTRKGEEGSRVRRSVSVTTREVRNGESPGVDYFFVSPEEFERRVAAGELLEWATYLDHNYGTPAAWVDQQLAEGYDVVLEIEVAGAKQVRERRPEAVLVYMRPPSWEELRRRLAGRMRESPELQQRRLEVARQEIESISSYQYVIVNGEMERAANLFLAILAAEHSRFGRADLSDLLGGNSG